MIFLVIYIYYYRLNTMSCDKCKNTKDASKEGHIECLEYYFNNGELLTEITTSLAAKGGHLDCLKFLYENGCKWSDGTSTRAATNKHFDCLKFAYENGAMWYINTSFMVACVPDNMKCFKYVHSNGVNITKDTIIGAALYGNIEYLKYIYDHNIDLISHEFINAAAESGNLDCLKYLHEKGCKINSEIVHTSAINGHLDCLEYSHIHCKKIHHKALIDSIKNGHLNCFKYCYKYSISNNINTEIYKFLNKFSEDINTEDIWWRLFLLNISFKSLKNCNKLITLINNIKTKLISESNVLYQKNILNKDILDYIIYPYL